jgi:hypothetical protein
LYEERAIRKQDTKDDTFDPYEDKDQSTPNHFNFIFYFVFITMQQPLNTLTIQQEMKIDKGQMLMKMEFKFGKLQI